MTSMEKLQKLLACGTGKKDLNDNLFQVVDDSLKIYKREGVFEIFEPIDEPERNVQFKCNVDGCITSFTSMDAYESHYNSNHRYTCSYCHKLLQSAHLLDLHLSETHDNFFKVSSVKKPMFKCYIETCQSQFWNTEERNVHCIDIHKISKSFLRHFGTRKNHKKMKPKKCVRSDIESIADFNMVID